MGPRTHPAERLFHFIEVAANGCWIWTGRDIDEDGYGRMRIGGRRKFVHRYSYEIHVGEIPLGLQLDHLCRTRRCVNPRHLEPVTRRVNILRGIGVTAENARKVQCHEGHAFTVENTYTDKRGSRHCRTCQRERMRRLRAKDRRPWSPDGVMA